MKQIEISFRGILDALWGLIVFALCSIFAIMIGAVIWHEANSSWWWKVPLGAAYLGGFIAIVAFFCWIYDKNPTIRFGGKKKAKLPKAKAL
jgi:membrane protein YdbS with pleckstrin-like domain